MASELSDEEMEEIVEALADGNKIEAIKIHRKATNSGLADSKEFIEALIVKLVEKDPEKYEKISASGGACSSVIIFALLLAGAAATAFVV